MPAFTAVIGKEVASHGPAMDVGDSGHYVAAAGFTLISTARQHLSDWVNNLLNTVMVLLKTFGSHLLLLATTLLGAGGRGGLGVQSVDAQQYLLGLGIGDVTGPIVETNMMGYASLAQTDTGLHMRQFSRAYIVATPNTNTAKDRILFVNGDLQSGDTAIRRGVLERLEQLYPGLYTEANFALVGTHSHSGVGGFLNNLLPQLTSLGFVKQTYDAIVNGTVLAVQRAHDSLALGSLSLGNTTVLDTNINRSPFAYEANPAAERARYQYDQDKDLHLLKFKGSDGVDRGFLSFFPVHGTSLYENNTLVSSDNKGMAACLYEASVQPNAAPGKNTFIAGFVQANVGDTSPNTLGAYCESPGQAWDGQPCEYQKSTCGNKTQDCHGRGPGFRTSDFDSNLIIGTNQFNGAKKLMASTLPSVSGAVRSLHSYVNMSSYSFALTNGTTVTTCPPAMGYSFAGGTTDGPGAFDFTQGDNSTSQNPFWEIVKGAVTAPPNDAQKACHYPKPILLNTGYANTPYPWQPSIVDIQMFRVGQLVMLIFPGELTTMSGRRIREAVRAKLISSGVIGSNAYVVVAGPANTYAHYVTTREEYAIQRYEGASTIFGPFTLEAYTDLFTKYVPYLADGATTAPPAGPTPEDLTKKSISLQTGVVFDAAPIGKSFGSVLTDVSTSTPYKRGQTVTAVFQGANPRNNLRLEGTYMTVDQLVSGAWTTVRTDSHPSTKFGWLRTNSALGYSTVTTNWTIESTTPAGSYRFTYNGNNKPLIGSISSFAGTSSTFTISV
ncbi:Neutral/alkaline nonlysosomal ceramidase [Ceratobasidium sp. AG-I]|nr:Neutral/alkaline nonlysosomal ceramidase [Ceratobasidium sp. AG-I]